MTSRQRVLAACGFGRPDRMPRFDVFWEYPEAWRERVGDPAALTDVAIWAPDEGTFPTRARTVRREGDEVVFVDAWGRTVRRRKDAYFSETLDVPIPDGADIDAVTFDPPELDERYLRGKASQAEMLAELKRDKQRHCVFAKTGGPFLRTCNVRGEEQFLLDMAADEPLAKALADKMARHLAAVGCEALRRWDLAEAGVWIYDDMGSNHGTVFSPRSFKRVLLPAYRYMIDAYKAAGAKHVFLHSDGNVLAILDMLVDAGLDGLHPLERRAGMDVAKIRAKHPRLILAGGMDNTDTLIHGPRERIEAEAREIIDLGRDGGVIIGTHSISPEIPLEHFLAYHETCMTYGTFDAGATAAGDEVDRR